jgi:hypothetical protein
MVAVSDALDPEDCNIILVLVLFYYNTISIQK